MKTEITNIQVALMYQTAYTGSFDVIVSGYKGKFPEVVINKIPLPDDFPADDVPRLEVKDDTQKVIARFSKSRADIFFNSGIIQSDNLSIFIQIVSDLGVTVGRIGYVQKTIYSEIEISYIREKIRSLEIIDADTDILEAIQKINKKTILINNEDRIECNNIASLTYGTVGETSIPALLLERDVNTRKTKNLNLRTREAIERVIETLKIEAGQTLFEMTEK